MESEVYNDFINEIPVTKNDRDVDYQNLKIDLLKVIIKHKVYNHEEMETLMGRTLLYNKHMEI